MPLPGKQFFTLDEVASRWGVGVLDLGCYAIDGLLTLSTVVSGIRVDIGELETTLGGPDFANSFGTECRSGVQPLYGCDVWPVFKGEQVIIQRLQPENRYGYVWIESPANGLVITLADLVLTRAERDQFEREHGVKGIEGEGFADLAVIARGTPGARPRHDWDGFWIETCRYIHDNGWTETQAALVRDLMEWWSLNAESPPDVSTVKKKVSRLWRESSRGMA